MIKLILQFIKFGAIGGINTVISWGIFSALYEFFGINEVFANITAFIICTLIAYILQVKFVFEGDKTQRTAAKLVKSYIVYGFDNGFIETTLIWICINWFGIAAPIAKIIPMFYTVPANFLLHKFWVYREGRKEPSLEGDK